MARGTESQAEVALPDTLGKYGTRGAGKAMGTQRDWGACTALVRVRQEESMSMRSSERRWALPAQEQGSGRTIVYKQGWRERVRRPEGHCTGVRPGRRERR